MKKNDDEDIVNGKIYNINGLDRTCYFYAEITNEGYPIKSVKSSTVTMEIYPRFEIGRCSSDKSKYCHGEKVEFYSGKVVSSYQDVTYSWENLNDKKTYSKDDKFVLDAVYEPTTFIRVASDGCGVSDTSKIEILVREKLEVDPEEYEYAKYAEKGKIPYIAVNSMSSVNSYVLSHISSKGYPDANEIKVSGKTESLIFESMPKISQESEKYNIYKVDGYGCMSVPDTFEIIGINRITAGTIVFENYGDAKSINICHGEKIGRVIDETVAGGSDDIVYNWYYVENGTECDLLGQKGRLPVTTPVFLTDTTNFGMSVINNSSLGNRVKKSYIFRTASLNVLQPDGTYKLETKWSDTLYVNVAPTLSSCNIVDLPGKIQTQSGAYCGGTETSSPITLEIDEDIVDVYESGEFGSLLLSDDRALVGYWEISRGNSGIYNQYTEAATYEDGFDHKIYVDDLDSNTNVRFTINDGCSTLSTGIKTLSVITFDDEQLDNFTINREYVDSRYIEEGDEIKVTNRENTVSSEWFSNKNDKSLIEEEKTVTIDSVTHMTHLYHKRISNTKNTTCEEPDYYEIPLNVHSASNGGRITSNQQVCPGENFADIKNYESAFGGTGLFRYRWEITTDESDEYSWQEIRSAFDDTLNYATYEKVLDKKKTNYIRRKATPIYNDNVVGESYTRYSNVISLETYKTLKVSALEWSEEGAKNTYCSFESVPYIKALAPTGGSAEYKNSSYKMDWMYSVDGINWNQYRSSSIAVGSEQEIYADGFVYSYFEESGRDKDVTFYVKAVFTDEECGEIETSPFTFKVWAETENPSLYIGADSCDSKYISFVVENDSDYYYNWTIGTDSVNPVKTDFKEQYMMSFERHPAYVVENGYMVQGMHKISGCKTDIVYFNVDSLPELQQSAVPTQTSALCYGSDLNITLSAASGGTGTKSYLWQYSYDNEKWNDANADKDFFYENVRSDMYVRRLVYTDVCPDTIATESVLYKVVEKIKPLDVEIEENMCKNQDMVVTLADSLPGNFNVVVYRLDKDTIKETELNLDKLIGKIKGNDLAENIFGVVTWDSSYTCKSEMVKKTILPRPDFSHALDNNISANRLRTCAGGTATISFHSDYPLSQYLKQRIESSADGITWKVENDSCAYGEPYKTVISDTTYFRYVLTNGCKDSMISDAIMIRGIASINNPMTFEVETNTDGSINIIGNNNVDDISYDFVVNDSLEYTFYNKMTLPKETKKIFALTDYRIAKNLVCYPAFTIKPLKEGRIFTECKSTGKHIVGEDVVNAGTEVTYKWYKYGKDSMMYFTDITDKSYELTVDDEKSRMQRVAYYDSDNVRYVLKSNILTVNANGPNISKIGVLEKDSLIAGGLKVTDHLLELNIGMGATLNCFIDDASNGEWQSSENGFTWTNVGKFDSTHLESQIFEITPTENMYYRVIATNTCGTATSDSIFVSVESIPEITEGCLELTLDYCEKTATIICYDDEQKNYRPDYYEYYFEVLGECLTKTLEGDHGISLSGILGEIEVVITRNYKGVSTKYTKRIDMSKSVDASFGVVVDNVEYGSKKMSGAWLDSVQVTDMAYVPSGTKIQLNNRSENAKSYKWEVYYEGIKMATSTVENPLLYVYNEGDYSFILTSYSGKCENTLEWKWGVRVQQGTLRYAQVTEGWSEDFIVAEEYEDYIKTKDDLSIDVYPTKFENEIHVLCKGDFAYAIYNINGMLIDSGNGVDEMTINTETLDTGIYMIVVNDKSFMIVK